MANREDLKRRKKKSKKKDITPFIVIGVLAVIVLGVIILTTVNPQGKVIVPVFHKAAQTDGLTMGDPNAPVQVVEFADFQCPGCGNYWSMLEEEVITNYVDTGKVFFTYSPFSFLGQYGSDTTWDESVKSAEAAYCANDQGLFWEYRDFLFANQNGENEGAFKRDRLLAFGKKLSLDMTTFTECLDSGKYTQTVQEANDYATSAGVSYTPSFLVNGTIVGGSDLLTTLEAAVNQ